MDHAPPSIADRQSTNTLDRDAVLFTYLAVDALGKSHPGQIVAGDAAQARSRLLDQNVLFADLYPSKSVSKSHPSQDQLAQFLDLFAELLEGGIDLSFCFATLRDCGLPRQARRLSQYLEYRIHGGQAFSEALRECEIRDEALCALLQAGETSGVLALGLRHAAQLLKERIHTRQQVFAKLAYPALLLALCFGLMVLFVLVIAPQFESILQSEGLEERSNWILTLSHWMRRHGRMTLVWSASGIALVVALARTPFMRTWRQASALRLPLIGGWVLLGELYWCFRVLALLLKGRVDLAQALPIALKSPKNLSVQKRLAPIWQHIDRGWTLSDALEACALIPREALQVLVVGERAGNLVDALERVASFFHRRREKRLQVVLFALQPTLLLFIGGIIAGIAHIVLRPLAELHLASAL